MIRRVVLIVMDCETGGHRVRWQVSERREMRGAQWRTIADGQWYDSAEEALAAAQRALLLHDVPELAHELGGEG